MPLSYDHVIYLFDVPEGSRLPWECDCGKAGSVSCGDDVELAAEKHVNYLLDETMVWRFHE